MAALLLLEPLLQRLHQLFEAAERLDELLFLVGQMLLGQPPQPFLREVRRIDRRRTRDGLDALEDMAEDLIEAIDMPLVLHQRGAGEIVEAFDIVGDEAGIHAFEQGQVLPQRNRDPGCLELEKEGNEHEGLVKLRFRSDKGAGQRP